MNLRQHNTHGDPEPLPMQLSLAADSPEPSGMCLQTFTGALIDPQRPDLAEIRIEDIAHALSMLCRFGGHTTEFYSVAAHSLAVSHVVPAEDALWGLLHDASEAYLVDIPRPFKRLAALAGYRALEQQWQQAIFTAFGLEGPMPDSVHRADNQVLAAEGDRFLAGGPHAWTAELRASYGRCPKPALYKFRQPEDTVAPFLARFAQLCRSGRC